MTIRMTKGATIAGRTYSPMDLVVGLSAADEARLLQGGDATLVASTDLPPSFGLSQSEVDAIKAGGVAAGNAGLTSGVRAVRIDGSVGARDSVTIPIAPGSLSGDGALLTGSTAVNHQCHTGTPVFLACSKTTNPFNSIFALGKLKRGANNQAFTLPYSGVAGVSTEQFTLHVLNRFSPMCMFRELQAHYRGALRLVANVSTGSTNTITLTDRIPLVKSLNADFGFGGAGMGNLRLGNVSADDSATALINFFDQITSSGMPFLHELPIGVLDQTAADVAWMQQVVKRLLAYARTNKRYLMRDPSRWGTNPATGLPYAELFRDTDNIHPCRLGQVRRAQDVFEALEAHIPVPTTGLLVQSASDRYSADNTSTNLYDGGWSGAGTNAATIKGASTGTVTGTVDAECTAILATGAGLVAACTLNAITDAAGQNHGYEQECVISAGAAGDSIQFTLTGVAGSLATRLLARGGGKVYMLLGNVACQVPAADIVKEYNIVVSATMSYDAGAQANKAGILGAALTNDTENIEGPLNESYGGLHVSNDLVIPDDVTAVSSAAILINVVLAAAVNAASGPVRLNWDHLTFREIAP